MSISKCISNCHNLFPNLKVIGRTGVGYDSVDVKKATELGMKNTLYTDSTGISKDQYTSANDLAILACRAQLYFQEEAYRFPKGYDPEHPQIDRVGLQGDAMTVEVCRRNGHIDEDVQLFQQALARDGELMAVLARILGELGYHG